LAAEKLADAERNIGRIKKDRRTTLQRGCCLRVGSKKALNSMAVSVGGLSF
jgi:hypothetical protein